MAATYTKLRSGDWGIRVEGGDVAVGKTVSVSTKGGTTRYETIEKVIWRGADGIALCAIVPQPK